MSLLLRAALQAGSDQAGSKDKADQQPELVLFFIAVMCNFLQLLALHGLPCTRGDGR